MEHFVEAHEGEVGYYISNLDEEDITTWCETCGDRDRIIFSFDENEKKEPFRSLFKYCIRNMIFSRQKMNEQLQLFDAHLTGEIEAADEILYAIECEVECNLNIMQELLENNSLTTSQYEKIVKYTKLMLEREYNYFEKLGLIGNGVKKQKLTRLHDPGEKKSR